MISHLSKSQGGDQSAINPKRTERDYLSPSVGASDRSWDDPNWLAPFSALFVGITVLLAGLLVKKLSKMVTKYRFKFTIQES